MTQATGMGNYPIAIYYKLMDGLKKKIPNEDQRKKHIIEKQLYMGELNKKNCFVVKQIFNIGNQYKLNLYEGDTLNIKLDKVFGKNHFDIIIGNPPYNQELTKIGALPLYNKFIEYYLDKCGILSFIVPSRWFSGGKGLDKFRTMMLQRTDINYIKHYDNACEIFGNSVDIKGGVNYFLIDRDYDGLCNYNDSMIKLNNYDILVESKYYGLVDKLLNCEMLTSIYQDRCFNIESNDKNLTDNNKLVKCYVSQQKGFIKYIDKQFIKKEYNYFKVITARASYEHKSGFGNTFIGDVNEIHTGSYISFKVTSENEAKSLLSYLKCKLPNLMLSLRKISQDISENTCKWIPLPPLNQIWNDTTIYEHFKLSNDDINLIKNTKIVGYKDVQIQTKYSLSTISDLIIKGANLDTFTLTKNIKKKSTIPYYTEQGIKYSNNSKYDGKYILCITTGDNKGTFYKTNNKFNANANTIIIKLKDEYNEHFDKVFEYIKNNFNHEQIIKDNPIKKKILGKMILINEIDITHIQNFNVEI
jgi:hypothetical protein